MPRPLHAAGAIDVDAHGGAPGASSRGITRRGAGSSACSGARRRRHRRACTPLVTHRQAIGCAQRTPTPGPGTPGCRSRARRWPRSAPARRRRRRARAAPRRDRRRRWTICSGRPLAVAQLLDQRVAVVALGRGDAVATVAELLEASRRARPTTTRRPAAERCAQTGAGQPSPITQSSQRRAPLVARAGRRPSAATTGTCEPVGDVAAACAARPSADRRGRARSGRVDPVALPLERIGRQRHAPALLAVEQRLGVERRRRPPTASERREQEGDVGATLLGVAQGGRRRDRGVAGACCGRGCPGSGPGRPRAAPGSASASSVVDAVGEAHRLAQVARPSSAGSVACSAVIQVPVRLDMYGICGALKPDRAAERARTRRGSGRASTSARRRRCARGVQSMLVGREHRLAARRSRSTGPDTTHRSGALTAAMLQPVAQAAARASSSGSEHAQHRRPPAASRTAARAAATSAHPVVAAETRRPGRPRRTRPCCGRSSRVGLDAPRRQQRGHRVLGREQRRQGQRRPLEPAARFGGVAGVG